MSLDIPQDNSDSPQQLTELRTALSSNSESGQWYDNPIYRDRSKRGIQSRLGSSARTSSENSGPLFDSAIYFSISTSNEQSLNSSAGTSNHDRSDSLEHEFDNPIYGHRNSPLSINRVNCNLQYL